MIEEGLVHGASAWTRDRVLQEALKQLEEKLLKAFTNTTPDEQQKRESLYNEIRGLRNITREIEKIINDYSNQQYLGKRI